MFNETLKTQRKIKGLSQENLAMQLNVVRQTISKWEKGISVPDAEMLIRIAGILDVSVSQLLGATLDIETETNAIEPETNAIAEQLSKINEQFAIKNRRSHRIWKTIATVIIAVVVFNVFLIFINIVSSHSFQNNKKLNKTTIQSEFVIPEE